MDEKELMEKAKWCDDCIGWLDVCGAMCCKQFVIINPNGWDIIKDVKEGKTLRLRSPLFKPEMKKYYQLHDATMEGDILTVKLNSFFIDGTKLHIYNKCKALTEDLKCSIHDVKPDVCIKFNRTTANSDDFFTPPKCLYRFKEDEKI